MELPKPVRLVYSRIFPLALRGRLERFVSGPYPRVFDKQNFIFVHIPKTAGKSVCEVVNIKGARHLRYVDYEKLLGERISDYFIFTVVRDPLDRLSSAFSYMVQGGNQSAEDIAFRERWIVPYHTFNDFVLHALRQPPVATLGKFRPQSDFLVDAGGNWVDSILKLRFETLADDIQQLPKDICNGRNLPHLNRSIRERQWLQLSAEAVELIREFYHQDFQQLSYRFPAITP